jgi:hypothetical protein
MDDYQIILRTGHPDFHDLPWKLPLIEWEGNCPRLEQVEHSLSRHPVVFETTMASCVSHERPPCRCRARAIDRSRSPGFVVTHISSQAGYTS